ncbi:zinc finger and SCAN domain-containing protein 21 [Clonorchis sinensis]|uniref:Zinc finger and SCAN domain-containing protein 21 n=1 Tax=Clonorchis sinensis TaxID=79923 RepID=H2KVG7_CLOSI|nr:zinc finger and SCAN domain-containing protein 21 [Clonorchis sinensis]
MAAVNSVRYVKCQTKRHRNRKIVTEIYITPRIRYQTFGRSMTANQCVECDYRRHPHPEPYTLYSPPSSYGNTNYCEIVPDLLRRNFRTPPLPIYGTLAGSVTGLSQKPMLPLVIFCLGNLAFASDNLWELNAIFGEYVPLGGVSKDIAPAVSGDPNKIAHPSVSSEFSYQTVPKKMEGPERSKMRDVPQNQSAEKNEPEKKIKTYLCPDCPKTFLNPSSLAQHYKTHSDRQDYGCTLCHCAYKCSSALYRHFKKAHPDQPRLSKKASNEQSKQFQQAGYKCDECQKCYPNLHCLRRHQKHVHTDEGRAVCDKCGASFFGQSALKNHLKAKHTNEDPFKCTQCERTFTRIQNLNFVSTCYQPKSGNLLLMRISFNTRQSSNPNNQDLTLKPSCRCRRLIARHLWMNYTRDNRTKQVNKKRRTQRRQKWLCYVVWGWAGAYFCAENLKYYKDVSFTDQPISELVQTHHVSVLFRFVVNMLQRQVFLMIVGNSHKVCQPAGIYKTDYHGLSTIIPCNLPVQATGRVRRQMQFVAVVLLHPHALTLLRLLVRNTAVVLNYVRFFSGNRHWRGSAAENNRNYLGLGAYSNITMNGEWVVACLCAAAFRNLHGICTKRFKISAFSQRPWIHVDSLQFLETNSKNRATLMKIDDELSFLNDYFAPSTAGLLTANKVVELADAAIKTAMTFLIDRRMRENRPHVISPRGRKLAFVLCTSEVQRNFTKITKHSLTLRLIESGKEWVDLCAPRANKPFFPNSLGFVDIARINKVHRKPSVRSSSSEHSHVKPADGVNVRTVLDILIPPEWTTLIFTMQSQTVLKVFQEIACVFFIRRIQSVKQPRKSSTELECSSIAKPLIGIPLRRAKAAVRQQQAQQ